MYLIGLVSPWSYNQLTKWANAPSLPAIIECKIEDLQKSNHQDLSAYAFSITIEDPKDSVYDLVFMTNGPGVSIYEIGTKDDKFNDNRNVIIRRFISSERSRTQKFKFETYINHKEQGTIPFKTELLSIEECPADIAFKRRSAK